MKIEQSLFNPRPATSADRCTPSPQSKMANSFSYRMTVQESPLSFVGIAEPVPRKIILKSTKVAFHILLKMLIALVRFRWTVHEVLLLNLK